MPDAKDGHTKEKISSPPSEWPPEAKKLYDPIQPLGRGGFGSVWMAKKKTSVEAPSNELEHYAIKVVGTMMSSRDKKAAASLKIEAGYARREIAVLSEISHPRIVRLIESIEVPETDEYKNALFSPYCMVLSYHPGPTLEMLLNYGGALGLTFARETSRQLIDAVSYLHGRAVIHRDIKPDNIIVSGASLNDDDCWSDDLKEEEAQKWNITLIDFGFARALKPEDVKVDIGLYNVANSVITNPTDQALETMTIDAPLGTSIRPGRSSSRRSSLDSSVSKEMVLNLSAVGNRHYAAPEVIKGVRHFQKADKSGLNRSTLSANVSDYGMVADAYSVGSTIRFLLTGVPPSISVEEFMAMRNHPLAVTSRSLKRVVRKIMGRKKSDAGKKKRKKRFRSHGDLPKDASKLVLGLTHWDQNKRTTVRAAKGSTWLLHSSSTSPLPSNEEIKSSEHGAKLEFLSCALKTGS